MMVEQGWIQGNEQIKLMDADAILNGLKGSQTPLQM